MENISLKIKSLIAENRLAEALAQLIKYEENKGRERYNTLILLKGKLEMLEEQEQADLLEFDDLSREKGKIAHAILKILDDPESPPIRQPKDSRPDSTSGKSSAGWWKYMLPLAIVAAAVVAIFMIKTNPEEPQHDQHEQTTVTDEENTPEQPAPTTGNLRLMNFPNIGQPFNFGDIKYHIKDVQVEQYSDTEIKLILKMDLLCHSNLGNCYREEVRIVVDGNPIAPSERKAWEGYLDHNASTKEELTFVFEAGEQYRILLEKNSSKWERGFKIIK